MPRRPTYATSGKCAEAAIGPVRIGAGDEGGGGARPGGERGPVEGGVHRRIGIAAGEAFADLTVARTDEGRPGPGPVCLGKLGQFRLELATDSRRRCALGLGPLADGTGPRAIAADLIFADVGLE